MTAGRITASDYAALAEFRYQIRRFLRFSEHAARQAGVEPQQHQLMLAVKGLPKSHKATIGELADRLQIQHHSTVELVDRLSNRGLVQRRRSGDDRREVIIHLTPKGEKVLRELALHHREELEEAGRSLLASLVNVMDGSGNGAEHLSDGAETSHKPKRIQRR